MSTRPRIEFDKNGWGNACNWGNEKKKINWKKKITTIQEISKKYKKKFCI